MEWLWMLYLYGFRKGFLRWVFRIEVLWFGDGWGVGVRNGIV